MTAHTVAAYRFQPEGKRSKPSSPPHHRVLFGYSERKICPGELPMEPAEGQGTASEDSAPTPRLDFLATRKPICQEEETKGNRTAICKEQNILEGKKTDENKEMQRLETWYALQ